MNGYQGDNGTAWRARHAVQATPNHSHAATAEKMPPTNSQVLACGTMRPARSKRTVPKSKNTGPSTAKISLVSIDRVLSQSVYSNPEVSSTRLNQILQV